MANEDYSTLATRKILISVARSCIGAHYLRGGGGQVPKSSGEGDALHMLPNGKETVQLNGKPLDWGTYFAAKNNYRICSGKHGHSDVTSMPKGDGDNPSHLANPDGYRWKRVVYFENMNPLWGESCIGKMHFDCSGFVKWCLKQFVPTFRQKMTDQGDSSIAGIRKLLTKVGGTGTLDPNDLCAADILIRKKNGHIGFAVGDGARVIQAEWEPSGVVETSLQTWDFHGRIPKEYWQNLPPLEEEY